MTQLEEQQGQVHEGSHRPIDAGNPLFERRLFRLREELSDEGVPLPLDGRSGLRLLAELTYARRPPHHESRVPGYGALVFSGVPDWDASPQSALLVAADDVSPAVLRRHADGRSSFTVVTAEGMAGLATFEHSAEDELHAVRLQRTGAVVVQRTDRGVVRACAAGGVVLWTGSRWLFKPLAEEYVRTVLRLAPHADRAVLAGLLEFAVHSLAAARVGATLVWNLDGAATDDRRSGLLELAGALAGPPLSVARRAHFPALRSVLSQVDLATTVGADGAVGPIGVRLDHTVAAAELVPALGGARHTSARRFSFDVPGVLVVVVSESGPVTVFSGGAVAAEITTRQPAMAATDVTDPGDPEAELSRVACPRCGKSLVVERALSSVAAVPSARVACPVCDAQLAEVDPRTRVLGVAIASADRGRLPVGKRSVN